MLITEVMPGSPAEKAGIIPGERLIAVNGSAIRDVLDYRFAVYGPELIITVAGTSGSVSDIFLTHEIGGDIGLSFETFLMDRERTCKNKCVFCFIDQMPKGCRASLYIKDDDARLSFLLGNYVTLTNMTEEDIERICRQKINPLGISVHTTSPELRVKMMRNPKAAGILTTMKRFFEHGIIMNAQIVLVPGWNDSQALRETLTDLSELMPVLSSVSVVPVGLTRHREGLPELSEVTCEKASETLKICAGFPRVFCSDELYLKAGEALPPYEYYEEFPQLENGVGMMALFEKQWNNAVRTNKRGVYYRRARRFKKRSIATGVLAAPFLRKLIGNGGTVGIYGIVNRFFGESVTVAGLVAGCDISKQLEGQALGDRLLIPSSMLKYGTDMFLDDMTIMELAGILGVPVCPVEVDGKSLYMALISD